MFEEKEKKKVKVKEKERKRKRNIKENRENRKMSFTVDKVQRVVAAVRRELNTRQLQTDEVTSKVIECTAEELDTLSKILFFLETCTDADTTQKIAQEIFTRAKTLWVTLSKKEPAGVSALNQAASKAEQQIKTGTGASSSSSSGASTSSSSEIRKPEIGPGTLRRVQSMTPTQ